MFDWFSKDSSDAISQLKQDHDRVKDLFDQFEKEEGKAGKKKIVKQALTELKIHSTLEEEIFYPAVRKELEMKVMNEADEEHHVAKVLIAELEQMDGRGDHYDAKFTVLAENVRHHIKEEEREMLPEARRLEIDFEELGEVMMRRRKELMRKGTPKVAEEAMVRAVRASADSPAAAARRTARAKPRKSRAA
jgi:hypothetical protein